eukprot:5645258-Amphidinium_carterae.1
MTVTVTDFNSEVDVEVEGEVTEAYEDEQMRKLRTEKDVTIAHLSKELEAMKLELDGARSQIEQLLSEQSRLQATAKADKDVAFEQLSREMSDLKHTVGSLNNAVAQLTDEQGTTQATVQDVSVEVSALSERLEDMQSMALRSMAMKEEIDEQLSRCKLDKDAAIERLDAAVQDAVSAAMKNAPEQELERVKASLKELRSPNRRAAPIEMFAFLTFKVRDLHISIPRYGSDGTSYSIFVTILRSDGLKLGSTMAPCKLYQWPGKNSKDTVRYVDDTEKLHECITRLFAKRGLGPLLCWEHVALEERIDN